MLETLKFTFISLLLICMIGLIGFIACSGNNTDNATKTEDSNSEVKDNFKKAGVEEVGNDSDEARIIEIEGLDNFEFTVTEITAKPGEKIMIKLINNSSLPPSAMSHNFILLKKNADPNAFADAAINAKDNGYIPKDMRDQVIVDSGLVAGGESKSVTFTVPNEPGDYIYICTFPGHFSAGMKGTLTVN